MNERSPASMAWASRLKAAQERMEREMVAADVMVANLYDFWKKREPLQDDEDDALMEAANLVMYATEQLEEAQRVLLEGV